MPEREEEDTRARRRVLERAGRASLAVGASTLAAAVGLAMHAPGSSDSLVGLGGLDLKPYQNTVVGDVTSKALDPDAYLTATLPSTIERLADGTILRKFEIEAYNKEIEIAPGVFFPAWTYNGQVPGPTLRATEGERIRVTFTNLGDRPHSMHFHGFHPSEMDGAMPHQQVPPHGQFVYEFEAEPVGLHLYHCHASPLTQHIHNGLYGLWIVDPKEGRAPARELCMMMNGFDPNFD